MTKECGRELRAVMYMRIGGEPRDLDYVVSLQRAACEQIAAKYGVSFVREYIDVGVSARLPGQVELQRLLAELEQLHDVSYVVVSDYARLARDLGALDNIIRRIGASGAEVATITGVESAGRLARTWLLEQVGEWTRREVERDLEHVAEAEVAANNDGLTVAVEVIRSRQLTSGQREALATLVQIAGEAILPTPVVAAVFNVIEACKGTLGAAELDNEGR